MRREDSVLITFVCYSRLAVVRLRVHIILTYTPFQATGLISLIHISKPTVFITCNYIFCIRYFILLSDLPPRISSPLFH